MTIDEAIAHAREKAKDQRYYANFEKNTLMYRSCVKCAEEHEQLAEWLEELKEYRALDKTNFSDGYNKAIDDFVEKIKENISESLIWGILVDSHKDNIFNDESDKIVDYVIDTVKETAEQLKAGGENEQSI